MQACVADEVEVLQWCIAWRECLERGERVVVNLRSETEDDHECVPCDHAQVLRVLARIAADFDALACDTADAEMARPEEHVNTRTRHRRRLAVPEEPPRSRTAKEQPDARRKAAGLPPYHGDAADDLRGTS
jgi:hypothetical protein